MGEFFGTDGVRGVANRELTCELAMKIGKAAALVLTRNCSYIPKILIGKDTRISSDMLESALLAGICSVGANGVSLGVVPTPAVSYLVKKYNADAGIMISASHNSFEFNGIKLFNKSGYKLSDEVENEIEKIISDGSEIKLPISEKIGSISYVQTAIDDYVGYISSIQKNINTNLKVAVDCANGSASATAGKLFDKLGINATILFSKPNGININENCGSTHLENLVSFVKENNCDMGIAFDGDADRCLCVDEKGEVIDGDAILGICAKNMKKEGMLKNDTLVGTIMSNLGLKEFCENNGINFVETKVGDRYVLENMLENDYNIGGEQSGHVIFLDYSTTGDGELTAVQILNILSSSNCSASKLNSMVKKYPQKSATVNIELSQKGILKKNVEIQRYLKETKEKLGSKAKLVVRESGTEPKIRVMAECDDAEFLENLVSETVEKIKNNL